MTINSKQTKPFVNGMASAFVCGFGQSKTFALTSIKKYVPSPCHEAHSHIINWPCTGLGSITIVIDCNRLQLERNRNCNRNQIFQIVV